MTVNAAAERAVLGAVMLGRGILRGLEWDPLRMAVDAGCTSELFAEPRNRMLWDVAVWLDDKGEPVDVVTISTRLAHLHQIDAAGGFLYLSALAGDCPCAADVRSYVEALRDALTLRAALEHAQAIREATNEPGADLGALVAKIEAGAGRIGQVHAGADEVEPINIAGLISDVAEEEARRDEGLDAPLPLMAGIESVDHVCTTWGLRGHRAGLAGRPSMGKTLLALQILIHIALVHGPVAFVSRESPVKAIARRIFRMERARGGLMGATRLQNQLDGKFFIIGPSDARTIIDARTTLRKLHSKTPLRAIGADYLQKFDKHTDRGREDLDLGEISSVWADLVEEMDCFGLMLAQLNRKLTDRTDKAPQLSDIRECGAFEQDCDSMLMIHRPGYFTGDTNNKEAIAFVRKQRDGGVGKAALLFSPGHWFESGEIGRW